MSTYNVWSAKIGDRVTITQDGQTNTFTVWRIEPAGSGMRADYHGPLVAAHIRPGGYGVTFDTGSYLYKTGNITKVED